MEDKRKAVSVVQFVHWSRSGITELLRAAEANRRQVACGLLLLSNDVNFTDYFEEFSPKAQLGWQSDKIKALKLCYRYLKSWKPDVVHCHSFSPLLLAAIFFKGKIVLSVHSKYDYLEGGNLKHVLKRVLLMGVISLRKVTVIAVSYSVKDALLGLGVRNVQVWQNGLPDTLHVKRQWCKKKEVIRACMISRLDSQKNIASVILAVAEHNKKDNAKIFVLDIYGSGSEEPILRTLIKENSLESTVSLKGYNSSVEQTLVAYDFFISASVNEAFGLSVLQACRAMVPIITTSEGEVAEMLWRMDACVKVQGADEQSIQRALSQAADADDERIENYVKKARRLFLESYKIEYYVEKSEKWYMLDGRI